MSRTLLMDEPLSALDKKLRKEIYLEIPKLHHRLGTMIRYVTHEEEALRTRADGDTSLSLSTSLWP